MPAAVRIELISKMAAIEHRLAYGTSDKLQLGALCGAFAGESPGMSCSLVRNATFQCLPCAGAGLSWPSHNACNNHALPPAEAKEGIVKAAQ